jgi:RND family efflux transporter MFP subunit
MKPVYRRWILIPALIIVPMVAAWFLTTLKPEPPKKDEPILDALVDVLVLETAEADFTIRTQGTVRPRTQTLLSSEISGAIVEISPSFVAGGVFGKGETLMRIDPTNYRVAVDKAEALVAQRQIEYDGALKLKSQGYRAEAELASSAAALAAARAELTSAKRNLERTNIRLPYEGMVLSKDADLGQFVNPGTRLGVTFATNMAEIRLPLTDQDLAFVEIPRVAELPSEDNSEGPEVTLSAMQRGRLQQWQAQIVRTEGVVDERSRVTYAVARVDDPYRLHDDGVPLPIGTFVSAEIEGHSSVPTIKVPRSALRGSDELIFIKEDNTIELRRVQILRADSEYAFISGGAKDGDRISLTALEAPTNGMPVRTTDRLSEDDEDPSNQLALDAAEDQ